MNDVNCKYSNEIVPYMYGELATSATTEFESHLVDCQTCTDEFAALSAARYEVYDWKKLEFDPLATPAIEISFEEVVAISWVEKLRSAFSASWAMPAAAFAGVAIIIGLLGVFVVSRDSGNGVVARSETSIPANDNTNAPKSAPSINVSQPDRSARAETEPSQSVPRWTVVSDSTSRRPVRTQPAVAPRSTNLRTKDSRTTTAQTPSVPRLNDFAEEEDNSLRLTELFEDIDTSE